MFKTHKDKGKVASEKHKVNKITGPVKKTDGALSLLILGKDEKE